MIEVFPRVAVVTDSQDGAAAAARVRDVLIRHGHRLTDDAQLADVTVRTDGLVHTVTAAAPVPTPLPTATSTARPDGPVVAAPQDDEGPGRTVDLLARVDPADLVAVAALPRPTDPSSWTVLTAAGHPVMTASAPEGHPRRVQLAVRAGTGRSFDELLSSAVAFVATRPAGPSARAAAGSVGHPAWARLKQAVGVLQQVQTADGSVPDPTDHPTARGAVAVVVDAVRELTPSFPHDRAYLDAPVADCGRWVDGGFGVPDFLDSLTAFHPERDRTDGREHLVVFPMYTQNGSPDRHLEAVLLQVIWPDFVADLEAGAYSNKLFVPVRFLDFTAGYDTNSAVLFPETVAMREVPRFTWGAIFADREAARFRRVVAAAAELTDLALPPDAARLLDDQQLTEQTFVLWDLIHDRTHMHGDLPFDPFMVKQRMPFFLYALEELRCDLTAFAESVALERQGHPHARLVQYAVVFDRIFRFAITGTRVRNYDGLGGQLLFAWLHQQRVLHWTDNRLSIDWDRVADAVLELKRQIDELYWRSIDRPKVGHWLAAYDLVSATVPPHPASQWAKGPDALPLDGPPKGLTDAVRADEFPLSMFYEALSRKLSPVIASTSGITG